MTKEPWAAKPNGKVVCASNDEHIATFTEWDDLGIRRGKSDENARRVVACVNACKGLSTEQLEKIGLAGMVAIFVGNKKHA